MERLEGRWSEGWGEGRRWRESGREGQEERDVMVYV